MFYCISLKHQFVMVGLSDTVVGQHKHIYEWEALCWQ